MPKYPNNIVERINTLVRYAKDTEQHFPTLTQAHQQAFTHQILQTGVNKQYGEIRNYNEYLEYGQKTLKEKFKPVSEEEFGEELKQLWDSLKGYRGKGQITRQQYKRDEKTLETLYNTGYIEGLDDVIETKKDRRDLFKNAYKQYLENKSHYDSMKYGYFEAVQDLIDRELSERQGEE